MIYGIFKFVETRRGVSLRGIFGIILVVFLFAANLSIEEVQAANNCQAELDKLHKCNSGRAARQSDEEYEGSSPLASFGTTDYYGGEVIETMNCDQYQKEYDDCLAKDEAANFDFSSFIDVIKPEDVIKPVPTPTPKPKPKPQPTENRNVSSMPNSEEVLGGDSFLGQKVGNKEKTFLNDYTRGDSEGEMQLRNTIITMLDFLKRLLIPCIVLLLTWAGVELFLSRGNEEALKKKFAQILATATGFAVILLTVVLVEKVFFGEHGEILEGGSSESFAQRGVVEIRGLINFITTLVVVIAVAYILFAAFNLIFAGETEDEMTNMKKQAIYAAMGVVIIVIAKEIVEFFMVGGDLGTGRMEAFAPSRYAPFFQEIIYWTNIVLSFVGVLAVISLIWAGIRLITQFGDDGAVEEAKKIMQFSVIALVLAFSAYTIIRYFIMPSG